MSISICVSMVTRRSAFFIIEKLERGGINFGGEVREVFF